MRYGFRTSPQNTTWDDLLATWSAADDLDIFESGWLFDHLYPIFSDPSGPCLEGWSTLAALAGVTKRLRLGLMVTGNPYRHPSLLANIAATVDVISGGRLELGIGAGWNQEECDALGFELPPLKERFDRFDEACEILIGLLSNEQTTFAGEHYQLVDAYCEPKPIQRPHPPIVIGGTGPKRTLRSVAKYAQHWNHPGGGPQAFADSRAILLERCDEIGRDPSEITMSAQVRYADPAELADQCAAMAAVGCDYCVVYIPERHTPAKVTEAAEALRG